MRRTKIICTLGPAVEDVEKMKIIINAGCDVARFNVAHGTVEEHVSMFEKFIAASKNVGKHTATMLDIKGPELRTSKCTVSEARKGQELSIGEGEDIELNHPVYELLAPGNTVLIHDGEVVLKITDSHGETARASVIEGGRIAPRMGVNVPGVHIPIPYIQERDLKFLNAMRDVDFVAASFTRTAEDICRLREVMQDMGIGARIIAKIENQEGVEHIDDILQVSDGIMVARGDLGTEIPVENLPEVQKYLLKKARVHGKPGIIATQILESMIHSPYPTRAEVSDIANGILDGGDALMLSGETAIGKYPVEAVRILARVAERADQLLCRESTFIDLKGTISESVSNAAVLLAEEVRADAILVLTKSGKTARLVSRHRPRMNILAATYNELVLRELAMYWGVRGFLIDRFEHADRAVKNAMALAEELALVKKGDTLVVVGGEPSGVVGTTNFVWVQIVGEVLARGTGFGNSPVAGKVCRYPEICDITVIDSYPHNLNVSGAKALIIESKVYNPAVLRALANRGVVALAGTGKIHKLPEELTVDPVRGVAWR
ncbi:MAG: pyruvate kinase [Euryarchaeota archaeon]|nr:pyruvate kinase [Euryarchaeota archaeon]